MGRYHWSEAEIKRELGSRANGSASIKLIGEQYCLVSYFAKVLRLEPAQFQ